jgi:hypothetical protein
VMTLNRPRPRAISACLNWIAEKKVRPVERRVRLFALSGIGQRIGRHVDSRFGEPAGHHAAPVHCRGLVFRHAHFRERIGTQR